MEDHIQGCDLESERYKSEQKMAHQTSVVNDELKCVMICSIKSNKGGQKASSRMTASRKDYHFGLKE